MQNNQLNLFGENPHPVYKSNVLTLEEKTVTAQSAAAQERRILAFLSAHHGCSFGASIIHAKLPNIGLLTSVRRALSDLQDAEKVETDGTRKKGLTGFSEKQWRIK